MGNLFRNSDKCRVAADGVVDGLTARMGLRFGIYGG